MSPSHTKVTRTSYGGNIKDSIVGAFIGILLFLGSFALLWINEGRSVKQIEKANFMQKNAIEVTSDTLNPENNDLLIATSGSAITTDYLYDGIVYLENTLTLDRVVEMYQWHEDEDRKTTDNYGGSSTTTTTYNYYKDWSSKPQDSSRFEYSGYDNPPFKIKSEKYSANNATFGVYSLSKEQISKIKSETEYTNLPISNKYSIVDKYYYEGNNYNDPQIGDIRISYKYSPSGTNISIIGKQNSDYTISPLESKKGEIYLQYNGLLNKEEMIKKFKEFNSFLTNILRFVGWFLMFAGLNLIIKPIHTVLKIIPPLAHITEFITGFGLFLISVVLSISTIAIAWLIYRPILAIALFVLICPLIIMIKDSIKKKKNSVYQEELN